MRLALQMAIVLALAVAAPRLAFAQAKVGDDRDAAIKLADQAFDHLENGEFDEAATLFEKAVKIYYTPVIALHLAKAEAKRGRLVQAREVVAKIESQPLPDGAKPSWTRAVEDALIFSAELDGRIPTVTVDIADGVDATLTIDGAPLAEGKPQKVNPGEHVVVGVARDGREQRETFSLKEKAAHQVTIVFEGGDAAAVDSALVGPIIAYSAAGVALVIGTVTGIIFVGKADELKENCPADVCPPSQADALDDTTTLGHVATVAWVIAGLGAAAGTVLLFVPLGDGADPAVTLSLSPVSATATVRF